MSPPSDKGPSSSGEHEAVRRLQDELARGEALTEAIATGASLPPASPVPPDATPITLPPLAERAAAPEGPDPLEAALDDLETFCAQCMVIPSTTDLGQLRRLMVRVRFHARRRSRPAP